MNIGLKLSVSVKNSSTLYCSGKSCTIAVNKFEKVEEIEKVSQLFQPRGAIV